MPAQWVYANGSQWLTLDLTTQMHLEALWRNNAASWISSQSFHGPVYADLSMMVLVCNGYQYSIARRAA